MAQVSVASPLGGLNRGKNVEASLLFAAQIVGVHRQNNDQAGQHHLPFLSYRHDAQAVDQHTHDEGADDGAQNRADTATQMEALRRTFTKRRTTLPMTT